ncbi:MAG: hypothetical protein IPM79_24605 [Polyangiaceae bacterium]|jgi:hypothetical protein|nr:hypothetical protein [Polyangiaceae bacterium]MBK8940710.1 hypothetical protein [Polyangiaceae bacterium]
MRWVALGCALLLGSVTTTGRAQPASPQLSTEERARALTLADEGARLFDQGDFNGAREKFEQAEAIVAIPPFSFQRARALERLGRWNEALQLYQKVGASELPKDVPMPHQLAKRDAQKAAEQLAPKVPRLAVTVAKGEPAEVYIDGRRLGEAGTYAYLVDPGEHVIEARGLGGLVGRRTITINASDALTVELTLAPAEEPKLKGQKGPSVWTILGYVGMGVGGASLVASAATGIPAITMSSELDVACPNGRCPASEFDTVDTYDALRWTAGATLIAGLVIAGAGVTSFLLAPEQGIFGAEVKAEVGWSSITLTVAVP